MSPSLSAVLAVSLVAILWLQQVSAFSISAISIPSGLPLPSQYTSLPNILSTLIGSFEFKVGYPSNSQSINVFLQRNSSFMVQVSFGSILQYAPIDASLYMNITECGVKYTEMLSTSSQRTNTMLCSSPTRDNLKITFNVTPVLGVKFSQGIFVINIGFQSTLSTFFGLPAIPAAQIFVHVLDEMAIQKYSGKLTPNLDDIKLDITIPSSSEVDPTQEPPALDPLTGFPFLPLKSNFFFNAKVEGAISAKDLIYLWTISKVGYRTLSDLSALSQTDSGVRNVAQSMQQKNSLGYSSLVLTQDKIMDYNSLYSISCVVMTDGYQVLARSQILMRTPQDIVLSGPAPPFSVNPQVADMTTEFTFTANSNALTYTNGSFPSLEYAYGYVNAKLVPSLLSSDSAAASMMPTMSWSKILQFVIQTTTFSPNPVQKSYLPPSIDMNHLKSFGNTSNLTSIDQSFRITPVMLIRDRYQGNTKIFSLGSGVCVIPISIDKILTFIDTIKDTISDNQFKAVAGYVQKAFVGGDLTTINSIQRITFTSMTKMINNMTVSDTTTMLNIAKFLEMWTFNATYYLKDMSKKDGSTIVSTLTKYFALIRTDARQNNFDGTKTSQPIGMIDSSLFTSLASALSNLIQLPSLKQQLTPLVRALSSTIVDSISPNEERKLVTDGISFSIRKDYAANFNGTVLSSDSYSSNLMVMPTTSIFNSSGGLFGTEFVSYNLNPVNDTSNDNSSTIISNVMSLRCINPSGNYFPLSDLSDPILMQFNVSASTVDNNPNASLTCKYWNETVQDWRSNGCYLVNYTRVSDKILVVCACDHTTQFGTFLEFSNSQTQNLTSVQKTYYYALWGCDIAVGLIFVGVSTFIIILLFIFRNSQPVKAKYIAPFVGMFAILVESFLTNIVKSSIMIGLTASNVNTPFQLNAITYVSSTIISMAFCVAVLTFVVQVIRYHLMRRWYSIIGKHSDENGAKLKRRVLFYRFMTSKLVFASTVGIVLSVVFFYFASISAGRIAQEAIEPNYSNQSFTSSIYTIVSSSFMGAVLVISLMTVSLIFIIDVMYSFLYDFRKRSLLEDKSAASSMSSVELQDVDQKKKKGMETVVQVKDVAMSSLYRFFVQEDPMTFRAESLLFICCLSVLLASYLCGIAGLGFFTSTGTSLDTSKVSFQTSIILEVVRLILSVIYFVLYVLVFGDLSLLVYIFKYRKSKKVQEEKVEDILANSELNEILSDQLAHSLFRKYSEKEFSVENVIAWNDLNEIQNNEQLKKEPSESLKVLDSFKEKYLTATSAMEVNVPSATRSSFLNCIQNGEVKEIVDVLETLKRDLYMNLSDTFSRFTTSKSYDFWKKMKEEKSKFIDRIGM